MPGSYRQIDVRLIPAATLTVLAHVELLAEKGQIEAAGPLTADQTLTAA